MLFLHQKELILINSFSSSSHNSPNIPYLIQQRPKQVLIFVCLCLFFHFSKGKGGLRLRTIWNCQTPPFRLHICLMWGDYLYLMVKWYFYCGKALFYGIISLTNINLLNTNHFSKNYWLSRSVIVYTPF